MKNKGYKNLNDFRNADGPYTFVIGPRAAGRIRYFIEQQMKGEQTVTNDFYKGMEHIVKSARDYAEVVKKNYEKDIDRVGPVEICSYCAGGAAAMCKMIEYLNGFDSFLKEYDNDNKGTERN